MSPPVSFRQIPRSEFPASTVDVPIGLAQRFLQCLRQRQHRRSDQTEAVDELMHSLYELVMAALLGLGTSSSSMLGAAIGLYAPISKRPLACLLAFAAGSLISALAIELAYEGAQSLHHRGFDARAAWAFVSAGFAFGAVIYYSASLFLERKGAAVRYVTQFREYAMARKRADVKERIKLLAACDLMRHLPAEQIEQILPCIRDRQLKAGEVLFKAGEPGDALYIVARGKVEVLTDGSRDGAIAVLGKGNAFGEMSLLSGGPRTATIRAVEDTDLLTIGKEDFDRLMQPTGSWPAPCSASAMSARSATSARAGPMPHCGHA
jgi:hypothetical protein